MVGLYLNSAFVSHTAFYGNRSLCIINVIDVYNTIGKPIASFKHIVSTVTAICRCVVQVYFQLNLAVAFPIFPFAHKGFVSSACIDACTLKKPQTRLIKLRHINFSLCCCFIWLKLKTKSDIYGRLYPYRLSVFDSGCPFL